MNADLTAVLSDTRRAHALNSFHDMIKFGTSGWRGIIARDFTFDNVRLATQGIADYLKSERPTAIPHSPNRRHSGP